MSVLSKSAAPVPGQPVDADNPRYRLAVPGSREGQWVDKVVANSEDLRRARAQKSEIWVDLPTDEEIENARRNGNSPVVGTFTRSIS